METKGDFLGFSFGGVHSSDLGIIRVSNGNRYDESLQPEINDKTAEIPGLDGIYYFGSDFGAREFDLDIAYDSITEEQFRRLRKVFDTKNVKELIFDERPYKKYLVKVEGPVELSYVCFDEPIKNIGAIRNGIRTIKTEVINSEISDISEGIEVELDETIYQSIFTNECTNTFLYANAVWYLIEEDAEIVLENYGITVEIIDPTVDNISFKITNSLETNISKEQIQPYEINYNQRQRIYKGEGKLKFKGYFPFAKSVYKQLPEESEEWASSSGILPPNLYSTFDTYNNQTGVIKIYNAGDVSTGFRLYCPFTAATNMKLIYTPYTSGNTSILNINTIIPKVNNTGTTDVGFLINTDNELIQGIQSFSHDQYGNATYVTSGNIYNQYVDSGYFFKLEANNLYTDGAQIQITDFENNIINSNAIEIFYDYLYF